MEMAAQLTRAIAVDPEFSCAHAELAWVYRLAADHDENLFEKSRPQAELAVQLDPSLGLAQFVLGYARFFWDWKFREAFERWLPATRSQPLRLQWYRYFGDAAMLVGEHGAAETELERGLALLPNSPVLLASRARLDFYRRDFAGMERRARKLVALHPGLHTGHLLLSRAVMLQGRWGEAQAHIEAARAPELPATLAALARLRAYQGDRRGVELLIKRPGFAKMPCIAGALYAIVGDHHQAELRFTQALQRKDPDLPYLLAEPDPHLDRNPWLSAQAATLGIKRG
jgi:tetratricopeptide (TPR) repeat protein